MTDPDPRVSPVSPRGEAEAPTRDRAVVAEAVTLLHGLASRVEAVVCSCSPSDAAAVAVLLEAVSHDPHASEATLAAAWRLAHRVRRELTAAPSRRKHTPWPAIDVSMTADTSMIGEPQPVQALP